MPPRHKTASTASKTVTQDTVDIDIDQQFSGRPLDRELWYQSNKDQLTFECHGAKASIEHRLVIGHIRQDRQDLVQISAPRTGRTTQARYAKESWRIPSASPTFRSLPSSRSKSSQLQQSAKQRASNRQDRPNGDAGPRHKMRALHGSA